MKTSCRTSSLVLLATLVAISAGCRLPGGGSPEPRHWVLTPIEGTSPESPLARSVGVGPVEIPSYLDRFGIVTRSGDNEIRVARFDVWGESFQENVSSVLSRNLEILVPGTAAVSFPFKGAATTDYRVGVQISRFEAGPEDKVRLEASWGLYRGLRQDSAWVADGQTAIEEPLDGDGYAAIVAAMSRALGTLSRQIAEPLAAAR